MTDASFGGHSREPGAATPETLPAQAAPQADALRALACRLHEALNTLRCRTDPADQQRIAHLEGITTLTQRLADLAHEIVRLDQCLGKSQHALAGVMAHSEDCESTNEALHAVLISAKQACDRIITG